MFHFFALPKPPSDDHLWSLLSHGKTAQLSMFVEYAHIACATSLTYAQRQLILKSFQWYGQQMSTLAHYVPTYTITTLSAGDNRRDQEKKLTHYNFPFQRGDFYSKEMKFIPDKYGSYMANPVWDKALDRRIINQHFERNLLSGNSSDLGQDLDRYGTRNLLLSGAYIDNVGHAAHEVRHYQSEDSPSGFVVIADPALIYYSSEYMATRREVQKYVRPDILTSENQVLDVIAKYGAKPELSP